ncbi:MAG: type I restriction-modification system subunit M N-terminal domain-containing protein [Halobacteriota archaeon]
MDTSECKRVILGLLFLKYISGAFEEKYNELTEDEWADPEDAEKYIAENIFWVPRNPSESALRRT